MSPGRGPSLATLATLAALLGGVAGPGCGKRLCPEGLDQDSKRSQPNKVVFCASKTDPARTLWIQLWDNGQRRQVCSFLGGRPGGAYTAFHKTGGRWLEGHYLAGVKAGRWTQWREDGQSVGNGEYRDGSLIQGAPVGAPATCEAVTW